MSRYNRRPRNGNRGQSRRRNFSSGSSSSSSQGTNAPAKGNSAGSEWKKTSDRIGSYLDDHSATVKKLATETSTARDHRVNTSPEVAIEFMPALLTQYPELIERIPWVSLRGCEIPSLPQRLNRSQHLFGENYAFMKRESLDFHTLPDNKARKLEFIIGDSLRRKRRKLVTFGYVDSSHCLATAKAASQLSMKSEVILLRSPLTVDALNRIGAMQGLKAKIRLRSTWRGTMITAGLNGFAQKYLEQI